MAWRSHGETNEQLVGNLAKHGVVHHSRVRDALLAVDRAQFTVEKEDAYLDCPQPIGHGATISAPHMHAHVLELLDDKLIPGAKCLDVGSGSGILLAQMAHLVTPGGKVYGIEHIPELVEFSKINLAKDQRHAGWLRDGSINVQVVDGFNGLPEHAPYDVIHVGAAAAEIPSALVEQLAPGGRMIIPVGKWSQELTQVDKDKNGNVTRRPLYGVMYVPLTSRDKQEARSMY